VLSWLFGKWPILYGCRRSFVKLLFCLNRCCIRQTLMGTLVVIEVDILVNGAAHFTEGSIVAAI
jgi:hypothetical protein